MSNLPVYAEVDEPEDPDLELARMGIPIPEDALPLIRETIESLRPGIQRDGGDVALAGVERNIVRVRLSGACVGCSLSAQTLGGIRRQLVRVLDNPSVRVVPAVD